MALTLYRRHTAACVAKRKKTGDPRPAAVLKNDRSWRRCSCPIHAEGVLHKDGFIRKATGETTWDRADRWKAEVEERGTFGYVETSMATPELNTFMRG